MNSRVRCIKHDIPANDCRMCSSERERRIWNAAIDKAVEVAKKTFTACSKNPTATPCNEMVAEELKKLKEV